MMTYLFLLHMDVARFDLIITLPVLCLDASMLKPGAVKYYAPCQNFGSG